MIMKKYKNISEKSQFKKFNSVGEGLDYDKTKRPLLWPRVHQPVDTI